MRIYFYFYRALERLALSEHFTSFSSVEEKHSKPSICQEINPCNNHRWSCAGAGRCFAAKSPGVPLWPSKQQRPPQPQPKGFKNLKEFIAILSCPPAMLGQCRLSRTGKRSSGSSLTTFEQSLRHLGLLNLNKSLRGDPTANYNQQCGGYRPPRLICSKNKPQAEKH